MKNTIRTDMLKDSIAEYTNIAQSIKENTSDIVNSLLQEAVANEYVRIMAEGFDKEDEDDKETKKNKLTTDDSDVDDKEAEDTDSDTDTEDYPEFEGEESEEEFDDDSFEEDDETEEDFSDGEEYEEDDEVSVEPDEDEVDFEEDEFDMDDDTSDPEDWEEFDAYKVDGADDQYDFSTADDETLVKVYKLLDNDDEVVIKKKGDKLTLKDNSVGTEYLIDLEMSDDVTDVDVDDDEDDDLSFEDDNTDIKESKKMIEIVLNEYDSHVDYDPNHGQGGKSAMTTPSTEGARTEGTNDWVSSKFPKGNGQRYAKGNPKSKSKPFNEDYSDADVDEMTLEDCQGNRCATTKEIPDFGTLGKGKVDNSDKIKDYGVNSKPKTKKVPEWATNLNEEDLEECGDGIEEATGSHPSCVQMHSKAKKRPSANKHLNYGSHTVSSKGQYVGDMPQGRKGTNESMKREYDAILKENKEIKEALGKLKSLMSEAAVTNMNLGQIVKILNENSTTQDEKREIIERFHNEAKTIKESKELYNRITRELSKKNTMNINEDKQFTTENSKRINESTIYSSKDLMTSLNLMHKICN